MPMVAVPTIDVQTFVELPRFFKYLLFVTLLGVDVVIENFTAAFTGGAGGISLINLLGWGLAQGLGIQNVTSTGVFFIAVVFIPCFFMLRWAFSTMAQMRT